MSALLVLVAHDGKTLQLDVAPSTRCAAQARRPFFGRFRPLDCFWCPGHALSRRVCSSRPPHATPDLACNSKGPQRASACWSVANALKMTQPSCIVVLVHCTSC